MQDQEEELSLGLAKFALMRQIAHLRIFDEYIVCWVIEEFKDQSLSRYAGPLVYNMKTADVLDTVREACQARPYAQTYQVSSQQR